MARPAPGPYDESRNQMLHELGAGIAMRRFLMILCVIFALGFVVTGVGWNIETRLAVERVRREIVVLDSNGMVPIARFTGETNRDLLSLVFQQRALDWITYLRSRPRDRQSLNRNLALLARMTDRRLFTRIGGELEATKAEFGKSERIITEIGANVLDTLEPAFGGLAKPDPDVGIVRVDWIEEVRGAVTKRAKYSSVIKLIYQHTERVQDAARNVIPIYVVEENTTQVELRPEPGAANADNPRKENRS